MNKCFQQRTIKIMEILIFDRSLNKDLLQTYIDGNEEDRKNITQEDLWQDPNKVRMVLKNVISKVNTDLLDYSETESDESTVQVKNKKEWEADLHICVLYKEIDLAVAYDLLFCAFHGNNSTEANKQVALLVAMVLS